MKIFNRYVLKNLIIATLFVSVTLAVVILLTQSLRFLELVIESGASSASFWLLTLLALPRFFEIILPLALMAATLFVYNRMIMDSEMVAARSIGYSPLAMARPAIILAILVTILLWTMTLWVAPKSLSSMQEMRQVIKAQFSTLLFREGVFNKVGKGLTVYIRERSSDGELHGLMIHDSRDKNEHPSTVLARSGILMTGEKGDQVLVYDGSRQEYNAKKNIMRILNFERYTIDLPDSAPIRQRWKEPDERTIFELLQPNLENKRDKKSLRDFNVEIHRRIVTPLLALAYTLISCTALLLGPANRHGYGLRIAIAIGTVITLQGLFLAGFNLSRQSDWGLPLMYLIVLLPLGLCGFLLNGASEAFRRRFLYTRKEVLL